MKYTVILTEEASADLKRLQRNEPSAYKKALKLIRGIASVRTATINDDRSITPALRRSMKKAREEYAKGETISCRTPEEMQKYFDSL